jgi:hypothetical protein
LPIHVPGGFVELFALPNVLFVPSAQAPVHYAAHFEAFVGIAGLPFVFVELTVVLADGIVEHV